MSTTNSPYSVLVGFRVYGPNDSTAVIVVQGRATFGLTIAEARELAVEIAKAADEAESKLDPK